MTYKEVFSFDNLTKAGKKCKKGVRWKPSTQNFIRHEVRTIDKLHTSLQNKTYKAKKYYSFDKVERGKLRHIKSQCIEDRIAHKCFCDNFLVPLLTPKLIYDNSACIKHKGVSFANERIKCHLQKYYRHFGNEGYVLKFDIHSFFANIDHNILKEKVGILIKDSNLKQFFDTTVDENGDIGLGLGSQISQICATFFLNELDHYIKHKLKIKYYARYMDDGYLIHNSKDYLKHCLCEIERILNGLGLKLNKKKTQIIKLRKGFEFLKRKYILELRGKLIIIPCKDKVIREQRKIKKMFKLKVPIKAIINSIVCWRSSIIDTCSFHIVQSIKKLFYKLKGIYYDTNKTRI